jgi:hypothetical protein
VLTFKVRGFPEVGGDPWYDRSGNGLVPCANEPSASQLYGIYQSGCSSPHTARSGKPVHARSGPFVDTSKMKFPKQVESGKYWFELDELAERPQLTSICFLDSFGQPILYYKANPAGSEMVGEERGDQGIYTLEDNAYITGNPGSGAANGGLNLGAGPSIPAPTTTTWPCGRIRLRIPKSGRVASTARSGTRRPQWAAGRLLALIARTRSF